MAGDVDGVEPLERRHPHGLGGADRDAHAVDPRGGGLHEVYAGVARVGRLGERADVAQDLAERVRVERDDRGPGVQPLGDRADVVVGDRAHRAQRLGDDQVGLELREAVLVQLVDGAALLRQLAHRAVDLRGRQPGADHVARDLGQAEHLGRVVALVRDGGNLAAEAEGEQHLGGGRDEGDDAHHGEDMALLSDDEIEQGLSGSEWQRDGDAIARDFKVADFATAMAFVNQVAEMAEAANHHPDILVHGWNRVRLTLSTHSQGGITQSDLDLARGIDGLGVG